MKFFYINNDKCTDCARCTELCPTRAIYLSEDNRHINYDLCTSCGTCLKNCGAGAITIESMERVSLEMGKTELYKARIQRLENELSSLKQHLSQAENYLGELVMHLPVATLVSDRHNKVVVANRSMVDLLSLDPLLLSDMPDNLEGESLDGVMSPELARLVRASEGATTGQSHVIEINGRVVSLTVDKLGVGAHLVIMRDLCDPSVAAEEIVLRMKDTIDRKMAMVQQIGFLLGEEVSVVVNNLNAVIKIVESTSTPEHND